ncbi:Alpha/Beta hydrolase protein [Aspergillus tamarii]|uniref:Alpha/Beta hydrolase protein n=1 Tax=Aspergillus tamarii TaxID=41984 RepID=A0A5N6V9S6_ASPTM|nr:Alpha/Beta hydrolase protein [Aspergillus tamarii]
MPTKAPTQSDFPPHLTISITSPNTTTTTTRPPPNILLLLHGIGDTSATFSAFGRALNLPETTILTLQAPTRLPFDLPGFHWGDDISFDSRTGALDMDAGFTRATRTIVDEVVRGVLVQQCGYKLREIMILGFGQGGMVGLVCARELGIQPKVQDMGDSGANDGGGRGGDMALSGVISIGAPYPISGSVVGAKNRTPVLLVAGRDSEAVSDGAVSRTKGVFEFVEVTRYARRGDGMPKSREEMLPVMRFLARRLRSWQGVPEGSVEIS